MKLALLVLSVAILAAMRTVSASVSLEVLEPNPSYPNACYDPKANKAYPVGSTWAAEGQCVQGSCSKRQSDGKYLVQRTGCGALAPPKSPCKVVRNEKAAYPDCCAKVECP